MAKGAVYTLAWSSSQQAYTLTAKEGLVPLHIELDSPAWFAWLSQVPSFAFAGKSGSYTARKESRHGDLYWYAYLRTGEKLSKKYLGKTAALSIARLEDVAGVMQANRAAAQDSGQERPLLPKASTAHSAIKIVDADTGLQQIPRAPPGNFGDSPTPLLATKLHMPRPRAQLVIRSQLIERLQEGVKGVLTLISAPAGFGKTTLLAQWLAASSTPVAWLSLEAEDNEPTRFLSYLIAALQTLDPSIGASALTLLCMPQPAAVEAVLTTLANDLVGHHGGDFVLVLDDYHVITAESPHRALTFLLEHMPPCMHLLLATRADPPLSLSRLRVRGQLCEVRAAELRFATEEASEFLHQVMKLNLSAQEITLLQSRTEGWIAGLQFAALSLQGKSDVSEFLTAFTGSHRFVLDYLSDEVLSQQPTSMQAFLLRTCVLERLNGPLCEAVTKQEGGQVMLEALDRANLFIVALDEERRWYRYHHLFAGVLRSRLLQEEPALLPELHRRASTWYEQHGFIVEAVQHGLAAPDVKLAARLIEQYGMEIALRGQVHLVLGWLNTLPDALLRSHARLCLYYAIMLMFTNQLEAAEVRLHDAEACLETVISTEFARGVMGWVAAIRANLALFSGDLARCIAFSYQTLELVPEKEVTLRASAATGPAHAYLLSGDVTQASENLVAATTRPVRTAGDLFALVTSITLLARLQVLQGRLRQAASTYEQVLQVVPGQEMLRVLVGGAGYYFGLGDLLREWNNLDAAEHALTQGMELVRGTLTVAAHVVTQGYTAQVRLLQARGDHSGALATLHAFAQLAHQRHFVPQLLAYGLAVRAQVELAQGNLAAASRWADTSGLSTGDDPDYIHEQEYLILVRVRIAQQRNAPADPFLHDALLLLERLLADAEARTRKGSVLEILILRALTLYTQGNQIEAMNTLERALLLAEPEGYIRLFVDEGPPMLALLRQAYTHSMIPGYITTLLAACGQPAEKQPLHSPRPGPLIEPLTRREHEVLQLLARGLSNQAIANELVVAVGTVKRHVNNICGKLAVHNRTQAIATAHTLHLL